MNLEIAFVKLFFNVTVTYFRLLVKLWIKKTKKNYFEVETKLQESE